MLSGPRGYQLFSNLIFSSQNLEIWIQDSKSHKIQFQYMTLCDKYTTMLETINLKNKWGNGMNLKVINKNSSPKIWNLLCAQWSDWNLMKSYLVKSMVKSTKLIFQRHQNLYTIFWSWWPLEWPHGKMGHRVKWKELLCDYIITVTVKMLQGPPLTLQLIEPLATRRLWKIFH